MIDLDTGQELKSYAVSTSARPPSEIDGSLGTPRGLHWVNERIGAGEAAGTIFQARNATGQRHQDLPAEGNQENLVTSRILWLDGLEPDRNQGPGIDSHDRYIYIHGTNHPERVGQPQSHGCILLRDEEMIELFDRTPSGTIVYVE